ncbi:MarR family winged helix-turn-helix transcriptional regulator [Georgenia sp. MJ173]|uniref:MarR family winged helix-turn-helix transcriptional regulator n=1 Tax=Georgenia sunbinii TaxID=3117728 RepID=UPI002F265228
MGVTTHSQDPDPAHLPAPTDASPSTWLTAVDPVARARQELRNAAPSEHLATILDLEGGSDRLATARHQVLGGVEELTGLRAGELHTLLAVADGAEHHRDVARRTGQADAAAAATIDGLVRHGLLDRHHHPSEPNAEATQTLVHVTPRGQAVLGQSEAIRVRLLDKIAGSLEDVDLETARSTVDALHHSLTVGAGRQPRQIGGTPSAS